MGEVYLCHLPSGLDDQEYEMKDKDSKKAQVKFLNFLKVLFA